MKVVITGIAGVLARGVAARLAEAGHEVIGIDRRDWSDAPPGVQVVRADIRKRPAEDVFRTQRPDALIHMATVTHLSASADVRVRVNLGGTRAVLEHCHRYGVRKALFIGRHTVYGAAPDLPLYRTEAEPPMASSTYPELADLVAADGYAGSALWQWPEIETAILRLVYILGPHARGPLASLMARPRVPVVFGFDPLFQFIHEIDAARAIALAAETPLRGVFNVTGPPPVPLTLLCRKVGAQPVPVPEPIFRHVPGRFGFAPLPAGAIEHIKYPVVVDGRAFAEATGFAHELGEVETMAQFAARRGRASL
ncbi:MAG: NAD-dependent epimerase/dehydratase family protein [Proteobacteria bacterium]|nr:NAD-dependent epimerase/dehydratase family protein [Pseudomonadota bacterium]